ncbi:DNA segregation ATPase FtsK/SpoIIIE, S-DNA-T family [Actinokineospora alba]|uniref:DNA segregation ATPase FtsK/SpoIIIE, S-DNA-T family n=1 Tax=Actinokineospora alba TaxID=504798 RepID=A0A1H0V6P3_9PSEU|nr:type VII secretion protein EccCa [Actinokineospora alba]TDP65484.1 S-DNA-T family DNA segregation ATPase FtsK/SpoIIIE [Actinokineospora alba]SDH63611.1 DNA segregation ATPase FtsK/SpoIIIE, S-DNA-T family [Actinokineospora alba]SDP73848.1 DNA segregation ATPase FtsK/SpoIIIE, S-DNA-T family [Actinokineospora alba]
MSTLQFKRSPRLAAPRQPGGEVHLEPPPEVPRVIPGSIVMKMLPAVMILASVGMMVFMFTTGGRNPTSLMFGGMMVMSTVGMMAGGMGGKGGGQKKAEMNEDRKDYLRYLGQMRDRAREASLDQRASLEWTHPDPQALWSIATSRRMWERRQADPDFCHLRAGRGSQRLATRLVPPQTGPVDELEPIATLALRRFVRAHSIVPELPIQVAIRGFAAVGLTGDRELTRGLARALIAQLVTFHTPEDVLVAVVTAGKAKQEWEWAKWLPHAQHPTMADGIGQLRMMAGSLAQIEEWLDEELRDRQRFTRNAPPQPDQPHIVIVIDDGEVTREEQIILEEGLVGVTLMDLSDSLGNLTARRGLRLVVEEERLGARSASGVEWFANPDTLSVAEAEALARKLSPYRLGVGASDSGDDEPLNANPTLLELLGIPGDPMTFDVQQAWRPRPVRDRYRVPFGIGEFGQFVELDIKESAMEGMGPHGLCIGATGSGKSEFLRTLVLGMLATHSSTTLNFILVDFKGGATFLGLDDAPHVAATITNLQGDLTLVDRMKDALAGEMNRRQEALKNGGNFKNVWEYEKARENGADLDPLPALFIVVDEFSELLAAKPDFIDLFVAVGRLGRSLQMHMLLASQRLEEGKLRGLDSHLSYRIGLKTFSAAESRAAIGVPDAFELPSIPGSGYLKFDTSTMVRFKAAYVSGPYRPAGMQVAGPAAAVSGDRRAKLFVPDYVEIPKEPEKPLVPVVEEKKPEGGTEASELDVIVGRLVGQGPPAHEVWLPPLNEPNSLDTLFPPLQPTEDRGLSPVGFYGNGRLQVPLGIIDKPFEQRRDLLWADFSGAAGHAAIAGGPQSGKSMMLRTLIMSMALTHTAEEVQFYVLDLGGGTMGTLEGLPHVGGVAGRIDPDKARRMVAEVSSLIGEREQRFRDLGIDSMTDFRNRKRQGGIPEDQFGDVFLIVDGWLNFRQEFESLESQVVNLAAQGLSYGIHVIVAANRWAEIRPALKDLLGTRFELRLGDPSESDVDRRVAVNIPAGRPGRGLSRDKLHFLTGLPRIDGSSNADDVATGVQDAVAKIKGAWRGRGAPKVRLLPEVISYEDLLTQDTRRDSKLVPIGIDENDLAPVYLDFDAEPHFMAFAEGESGKTNLIRTIVRGIMDRYTPQEAVILLVDYRRTMLGFIDTNHLLGYAVSSNQLGDMVKDVRGSMLKRLPGPDVTQDQLRNRSWWKGPELFVIVDDYDLVAPQGNNPLQPIAEFLPQAKDVGLHVIAARRSGGASRAMFDPILGKLREIASPGIVMSGSKDEGALLGTVKPSAMPPGRGTLVSRKVGQALMHVAWIPPE